MDRKLSRVYLGLIITSSSLTRFVKEAADSFHLHYVYPSLAKSPVDILSNVLNLIEIAGVEAGVLLC